MHQETVQQTYNDQGKSAKYDKVWDHTKHRSTEELTDGFGNIKFFGSRGTSSKFLRFDIDTPVDKVTKVLFDNWQLYKPGLIISVTGGAENVNLKPSLGTILKKGIVEAALSTGMLFAFSIHYKYDLTC
jgi:hypothetical protein